MSFADTLSDAERKRGRIYATLSACSGCISEVMLDSSAIIILLFTMMKASSMVTMLTSSLSGLLGLILMIPYAGIADKIGMKRAVKYACIVGCTGFLMIAVSPWFPYPVNVWFAFAGCFIYCSQRSLYAAAWYPLLDGFLKESERGKFFSVMRVSYMLFNGCFLFLVGLLLGKNPPFWLMQSVVAFAGVTLLLRWYCIDHFPMDPDLKRGEYDLKKSLSISIRNAPLTGFSVYLCFFNIAYLPLLPMVLLYLRKYAELSPGLVQILSSVGIGGSITGYYLYGLLTKRFPLKYLELTVHLMMIALALLFFFTDKSISGFPVFMGIYLFLLAVGTAWSMCNCSMEFLALGKPGNKTMAMAFCQTYGNAGTAIGRTGGSLILGTAMLAPVWTLGGRTFCVYQSVFLLSAILSCVTLIMLPVLPSFVPKHEDYYNPGKK